MEGLERLKSNLMLFYNHVIILLDIHPKKAMSLLVMMYGLEHDARFFMVLLLGMEP
jgi:hypothetical protein